MEKGTQEGPTDKKCLTHSYSLVKREGQIRSVFLKGFPQNTECLPNATHAKQEFPAQVTF